MATRDIVVIGASAGGVEALKDLVQRLPANLDAAIFVVVHMPASAESVLPGILSRNGPVPAKRAVHGEPWERGRIYVAPPDHHLLLLADRLRVQRGPRVWGLRTDEVVGRHLMNLDIGLPVADLAASIRSRVQGDGGEIQKTLDCTNRRGKPVTCKVFITPLASPGRDLDDGGGVIILVEETTGSST